MYMRKINEKREMRRRSYGESESEKQRDRSRWDSTLVNLRDRGGTKLFEF